MSNVVDLTPVRRQLRGTGGPPDNDGMQARVEKLEALAEKTVESLHSMEVRLALIEARQAEFAKHFATKADLTDAQNKIIVWVVAAVFFAQLMPVIAGLVKHYFP